MSEHKKQEPDDPPPPTPDQDAGNTGAINGDNAPDPPPPPTEDEPPVSPDPPEDVHPVSDTLIGQILLSGSKSLLAMAAAFSFVVCASAVAFLSFFYPLVFGDDGNTFLVVSTINFLLKIIGASAIVLLILAINRQAVHIMGLLVIAALVIATPDIIRIALIATGSDMTIDDFYARSNPPETQSRIVGNATNDVDRILTILEDKNLIRSLEQQRRRSIYEEYSSLKFSERVGVLVERAQRNSSIIPLNELARGNFEAWSFRYTSDNTINSLLDQLKSDGLIVFVSNDYKTAEITALGCSVVSIYTEYPFDLRFPHKLRPSDYTLRFLPAFVESFPNCAGFTHEDSVLSQNADLPGTKPVSENLTVWETSDGGPIADFPASSTIQVGHDWQIVEFSVAKTSGFNIDVMANQISGGDPTTFLYIRPENIPEGNANLGVLSDQNLIDENDDHTSNSPILDVFDSRLNVQLEANQKYWLVLRDLPEEGGSFDEQSETPSGKPKVPFTIWIREITADADSDEVKDAP